MKIASSATQAKKGSRSPAFLLKLHPHIAFGITGAIQSHDALKLCPTQRMDANRIYAQLYPLQQWFLEAWRHT